MPPPGRPTRSWTPQANRSILVVLLLTGSLVHCAAPRAESIYDRFIIPESDFFENTNRVALVPLYFDDDITVPDTIVAAFDSLVQAALADAGFSVIPALVYTEIWSRILEDVGGIFDPYTGRRDEGRFQAATTRLREELTEKFSPDVLVLPELWVVEAPYGNAVAEWDGTSQDIWDSGLRRGQNGFVLALSFGIVVEDLHGTELFVNGGGLEVLETVESEIPAEELFADAERIRLAVQMALEPLTRGRAEATPPR